MTPSVMVPRVPAPRTPCNTCRFQQDGKCMMFGTINMLGGKITYNPASVTYISHCRGNYYDPNGTGGDNNHSGVANPP